MMSRHKRVLTAGFVVAAEVFVVGCRVAGKELGNDRPSLDSPPPNFGARTLVEHRNVPLVVVGGNTASFEFQANPESDPNLPLMKNGKILNGALDLGGGEADWTCWCGEDTESPKWPVPETGSIDWNFQGVDIDVSRGGVAGVAVVPNSDMGLPSVGLVNKYGVAFAYIHYDNDAGSVPMIRYGVYFGPGDSRNDIQWARAWSSDPSRGSTQVIDGTKTFASIEIRTNYCETTILFDGTPLPALKSAVTGIQSPLMYTLGPQAHLGVERLQVTVPEMDFTRDVPVVTAPLDAQTLTSDLVYLR